MKIFLLGASGRTGCLILEQAIQQGHRVHILVTSPEKIKTQSENLTIFAGSPLDYAKVVEAMEGCDVVISAINILRQSEFPWAKLLKPENFLSESLSNVIKAMDVHGIDRIVISTAWGVGDSMNELSTAKTLLIKNSYIGIIYDDHERQEKLLKSSFLQWTVVRPVSLTNSSKQRQLCISVDGSPKPGSSISRKQTAAFMLDCAVANSHIAETVTISEK